MDEDETLPLLLQSAEAITVIRTFKHGRSEDGVGSSDDHPIDPSQVRNLQGRVFGRIDGLEAPDTGIEVPPVPDVVNLTEDMSKTITDVRNGFREQLTKIIDATANLFEHLVELTQSLDQVRTSHEKIIDIVQENMNDAYDEAGQT